MIPKSIAGIILLATFFAHGRPFARLPFGSLWLPFGSLWLPFGSLWLTFGSLLVPSGLIFSLLMPPGFIFADLRTNSQKNAVKTFFCDCFFKRLNFVQPIRKNSKTVERTPYRRYIFLGTLPFPGPGRIYCRRQLDPPRAAPATEACWDWKRIALYLHCILSALHPILDFILLDFILGFYPS